MWGQMGRFLCCWCSVAFRLRLGLKHHEARKAEQYTTSNLKVGTTRNGSLKEGHTPYGPPKEQRCVFPTERNSPHVIWEFLKMLELFFWGMKSKPQGSLHRAPSPISRHTSSAKKKGFQLPTPKDGTLLYPKMVPSHPLTWNLTDGPSKKKFPLKGTLLGSMLVDRRVPPARG